MLKDLFCGEKKEAYTRRKANDINYSRLNTVIQVFHCEKNEFSTKLV